MNLTAEEIEWCKNPNITLDGVKRILTEILEFSIKLRNRVRKNGKCRRSCIRLHEEKDVCEFIDKRNGISVLTDLTDIGIHSDRLNRLLQKHDSCHTVP